MPNAPDGRGATLRRRSREELAINVTGSIRSERVIEVLSRLISERGAPKALRSDNGPEFVSSQLLQWATDECLSMEYFRNRLETRVVIEQWRRHNNEVRPHSALGYLTQAQNEHLTIFY